jgi:hypothetical protein
MLQPSAGMAVSLTGTCGRVSTASHRVINLKTLRAIAIEAGVLEEPGFTAFD